MANVLHLLVVSLGNQPACGRWRRVVVAGLMAATAATGGHAFQALTPGQDPPLREELTVNVVRIGLGELIDPQDFAARLPAYNGVARPADAGGRKIEIEYHYRYNIIDAPPGYASFLFGELRAAAVPQTPLQLFDTLPPLPLSVGQALYNYCNVHPAADPQLRCLIDPGLPRVNPRVITQNHLIDASYAEALLAHTLPALGIDVSHPTVVLMNWWGRPDYVDHIYLQPDEPVRETGVPRGLFLNNELGGYGGTPVDDPQTCARLPCLPHRIWFVDLSAGPLLATASWDLVSPAARTNYSSGRLDYRIHHIADYLGAGDGTYRPLNNLGADLARLVADVFLGTVATASPVYPPALSAPRLPKHLHVNLLRYRWGDPRDLEALLDRDHLLAKISQLPYRFTLGVQERTHHALDARLREVARNTLSSHFDIGGRLGSFSDLYFHWHDHLRDYLTGQGDHELTLFQFGISAQEPPSFGGGLADRNWATLARYPHDTPARLRQAEALLVTRPDQVPFASHSHTAAHEVGHYVGLPHPFQGSRCLDATCAQPRTLDATGPTFYSWQGAYVHSPMSYVLLNDDFGRFDRDNMHRWVTYQHLRQANALLGRITAHPRRDAVAGQLLAADARAAQALQQVAAREYEAATAHMRAAFDILIAAAGVLTIPVEPQAKPADERAPPATHTEARQMLREFQQASDPPGAFLGWRGLSLHSGVAALGEPLTGPLPALPPSADPRRLRFTPGAAAR